MDCIPVVLIQVLGRLRGPKIWKNSETDGIQMTLIDPQKELPVGSSAIRMDKWLLVQNPVSKLLSIISENQTNACWVK